MWDDRYKDIESEHNYQMMLLVNSPSPANTMGNNHEPRASGIHASDFRLVMLSPPHPCTSGVGILVEAGGSPAGCTVLLEGDRGKGHEQQTRSLQASCTLHVPPPCPLTTNCCRQWGFPWAENSWLSHPMPGTMQVISFTPHDSRPYRCTWVEDLHLQ